MSIHVAILRQPYLRAILDGRKTIESRLSRIACEPHGMVRPGERLYLKQSGGPFMATAVAREVMDFADLTAADVARIEQRYRPAIGGDDEYWRVKRDATYATLIRLAEVTPLDVGPMFGPANMKAWFVLPDSCDIVRDAILTAGNLRNRHVSVTAVTAEKRRGPVTLQMPDGLAVQTEFAAGGPMLRWRGWGRYFDAFALRPGDVVRFVATGPREYRVLFRAASGCG